MIRSNNPFLNQEAFKAKAAGGNATSGNAASSNVSGNSGGTITVAGASSSGVATTQGAVSKVLILLGLVILSAVFSWQFIASPAAPFKSLYNIFFMVSLFGAIGVAFVVYSKPHLAKNLAIIYALLQGLVISAISGYAEQMYPGIIFQAVIVTFAIFTTMLLLYKARIIRVTQRFRSIMMTLTLGIFVFFMFTLVLSLFGVAVPLVYGSGGLSLLFYLFVGGISALMLLMDFDAMERIVDQKLPKHYEWVAAFGLIVTLIWLYINVLRILMILRGR